MSILLALAALAAMPQAAPQPALGKEIDRIPFAANGGIRDWEEGAEGDLVYLRARGKWYAVRLSGPCIDFSMSPRLLFRTGMDGAFDRFSQIMVADRPGLTCGVQAIHESEDPRKAKHAED